MIFEYLVYIHSVFEIKDELNVLLIDILGLVLFHKFKWNSHDLNEHVHEHNKNDECG